MKIEIAKPYYIPGIDLLKPSRILYNVNGTLKELGTFEELKKLIEDGDLKEMITKD